MDLPSDVASFQAGRTDPECLAVEHRGHSEQLLDGRALLLACADFLPPSFWLSILFGFL